MKRISVIIALVASVALSGCYNAGEQLAIQSHQIALCKLQDGPNCKDKVPEGAIVEPATVAAKDDAVRVSGFVKTEDECTGYAHNVKARRGDYILQAVINDTVVTAFGEVTSEKAVEYACGAAPYKVALTMAKVH